MQSTKRMDDFILKLRQDRKLSEWSMEFKFSDQIGIIVLSDEPKADLELLEWHYIFSFASDILHGRPFGPDCLACVEGMVVFYGHGYSDVHIFTTRYIWLQSLPENFSVKSLYFKRNETEDCGIRQPHMTGIYQGQDVSVTFHFPEKV